MTYYQRGTVIRATMRTEDLVPAFMGELRRVNHKEYKELLDEFSSIVDKNGYLTVNTGDTLVMFLLEALFDALSDNAPAGMYFGSHPGDGSDYGWWVIEPDGDEELIELVLQEYNYHIGQAMIAELENDQAKIAYHYAAAEDFANCLPEETKDNL